jgi:hypothetical protein
MVGFHKGLWLQKGSGYSFSYEGNTTYWDTDRSEIQYDPGAGFTLQYQIGVPMGSLLVGLLVDGTYLMTDETNLTQLSLNLNTGAIGNGMYFTVFFGGGYTFASAPLLFSPRLNKIEKQDPSGFFLPIGAGFQMFGELFNLKSVEDFGIFTQVKIELLFAHVHGQGSFTSSLCYRF